VKDIFALRLYTRVARLGSFSAAARECGLSQSQASRVDPHDFSADRTSQDQRERAEQAMPLDQFISEAIAVLASDANEIVVAGARPLRDNAGPTEHAFVDGFNARMLSLFSEARSG
jgi:hypothetical protein